MTKDELIELTNKLYRLTLLFPKKEPLRYKVREVADEILAGFTNWETFNSPNPGELVAVENSEKKQLFFELEKNLDVLNSYFEIAKWQNWVNYFDVLEIQEKYSKMKSNLGEEIKEIGTQHQGAGQAKKEDVSSIIVSSAIDKSEETPQIPKRKTGLEPRKEKILKILGRVERIQVGQIDKLFPEVSKRTLRRDFQELVKQDIVEKIGEKNDTFYRIKTG